MHTYTTYACIHVRLYVCIHFIAHVDNTYTLRQYWLASRSHAHTRTHTQAHTHAHTHTLFILQLSCLLSLSPPSLALSRPLTLVRCLALSLMADDAHNRAASSGVSAIAGARQVM